jgi:hypothetical protein
VVFGALLTGCVAIEDIQTPNGSLQLSPDEGSPDASPGDADAACREQGWVLVSVAGRDQLPSWSAPSLTLGCGAAPHRLSALAPRQGSTLSLNVAAATGRVLDGTYSTTRIGADGEEWGAYDAPIDVDSARFAAPSSPTVQPFQIVGTIFGPFGLVPIALSGCARIIPAAC